MAPRPPSVARARAGDAPTLDRIFLLSRYRDGFEEAMGDDKDEVKDIVMHYRQLVAQRLKTRANSLPMGHFAGQIGSILFDFYPEFPAAELPLAGGISEFEFRGYEFRFATEGARAVETINLADYLHSVGLCRPYYCIEPSCKNYSLAVDDRMIFSPELTFFFRYAPKYSNAHADAVHAAPPLHQLISKAGSGAVDIGKNEICIAPGEYLVGTRDPSGYLFLHGELWTEGHSWEVMPTPTDASQLDMHLARMSGIDSRYVLLFTNNVKHLFDSTWHDDSEESDGEDAYVKSALVPGLQQRDFNRAIDAELALGGLTLSDETRARMEAILRPA